MIPRRALLSVSDKTGLVDLARALTARGVELLSTDGTLRTLTEAGLPAIEVSAHTGFPEIMDGRVKTLHPKIHGGLLGRRGEDDAVMRTHGIAPIDLLCVNLYPFEATVARPDCTLQAAIENIDIGGPAMVRAAAKNWKHVAVLTDPTQYRRVVEELAQPQGVSEATRFDLAVTAFNRIARYDAAISDYLSSVRPDGDRDAFPDQINLCLQKVQNLRYGENPHQQAAFYRETEPVPGSLASFRQLQGKELSYNNVADADAAWECVRQFAQPACVIVKHANPCGVALGGDPVEAYHRAYATDPLSAFGGIIAFNRPLTPDLAKAIVGTQFAEVIIATGADEAALAVTRAKENIRVLVIPSGSGRQRHDLRRVGSGLLVQTPDDRSVSAEELRVVTTRTPTDPQLQDLLFAWRVAKFVKSNAIVYARDGRTLGIGAGQMSRVDSARIAALKAEEVGFDLRGAVMASDAFFPFRDGVDTAGQRGIAAVIQPGGSMRDAEVVAAANEAEMAMVFTGVRHFRH